MSMLMFSLAGAGTLVMGAFALGMFRVGSHADTAMSLRKFERAPIWPADRYGNPTTRPISIWSLLKGGEDLKLVVQPIVDLHTRSVHAYESLARMGPDSEAPGPYFERAIENGLRSDLEYACLVKAMDLLDVLPHGANLMVNISAETLASPHVVQMLSGQRDLSGLVLEISEESSDDAVKLVGDRVGSLIDAGLTLAVDDVGAGPAGLTRLTSVNPRYIKLDRSLIAGIDKDRSRSKLVAALNGYAASIGGWTVAEGIETEGELAELERLGIPYGQGFLLARPSTPWPLVAVAPRDETPELSAVPSCCVGTRHTSNEVLARFNADPSLDAVAIVDEERRPQGVLTRARLTDRLDRPHGPALYGGHPALVAATQDYLALFPDADWREMRARAMARPRETRHDPIVQLDGQGRFRELISIEDLLEAAPLAPAAPVAVGVA